MKPMRIQEPDPALNMRWIEEHGAEYAGHWVAPMEIGSSFPARLKERWQARPEPIAHTSHW